MKTKYICFLLTVVFIPLLFHGYFLWILHLYSRNPLYFYILFTPLISYLLFRDVQANPSFKQEPDINSLFWFFIFLTIGLFVFLPGTIYGLYLFPALSLPCFIFSLCCLFYGLNKSKRLIFPCFFLIFLYPFEWQLSFLNDWLNRLNAIVVSAILDRRGFTVALSLKDYSLKVTGFTLILAERCSGLDLIIVMLMFFSILPWKCGLNLRQTLIWLSSIPFFVILFNFLRILLLTLAGISGRQWYNNHNGSLHGALNTFYLFLVTLSLLSVLKYLRAQKIK